MLDAAMLVVGVLCSFLFEIIGVMLYFWKSEQKIDEGEVKILLGMVVGGFAICLTFAGIAGLIQIVHGMKP